jgi:hypothetical protein
LKGDDLIVVDDSDGGECIGWLAGGEKGYECKRQQASQFHESNYTLPKLMHDPYIGFDVNTFIFFNIYLERVERAWDDVFSALWKLHTRPCFPFGTSASNSL